MKQHEKLEKNVGLLALFMILAVSIGGLVQIVPLFFQDVTNNPVDGMKPYTALQLEGRDIYIREGCVGCHSQMIRPFRAETERYGHYSVAGESVWDHPFLWGSKRTGPDLARVGGRYSDDWHRAHLYNPRNVVPESKMPAYPWLFEVVEQAGADDVVVPVTGAFAPAAGQVVPTPDGEALVAYLLSLKQAPLVVSTTAVHSEAGAGH